MGRPTKFTNKLADEILMRMYNGESMRSICKLDHMPNRSTVNLWIAKDRNGFSDRYAKALDIRAHHYFEDLVAIADGEDGKDPKRDRLRCDTRKWIVCKLIPKYSDKQQDADEAMEPIEVNINVQDASKRKHK